MFGAFGGGPGMFGSFQDLMRSASTGGSFQELMRSATSGSLHFEESELMRSATLNGIRAGESVMELDEGYIGEQEWGGGDCSDFSPLSGEDETEEDKREDGGAEEDKREDGWGLGYDSVEEDGGAEDGGAEDGSEYSDRVEEGTNNKTVVGVHLGDCGCITAEGDGSEEVLSEESDSEESECEEEITIEVDLCQEIYTPPTQDIGPYKKSLHEANHNHPLSRTAGEKREWNSHRQIEPFMKEMIKYLRQSNITRDQMDDDIRKTMEIFRDMHEKDPDFQFSVELDKRSRIRTLLWCSGKSRDQYACFGDVVTFDTTYCTNIYKMPFGLFVGVNNHFQTTIFGGVLMR
ncbi:hypothetical protein SORBI_3004G169966 [Sorghum bicolor]|uniref:Protein FAR1-RELATED SEQUENCE n=1 Tax=Sorghum bicolor TaxID=4558 RepID=A0A1Z5RNE5_SORBI|nr:hypothetical protein SORBI_3004G169966 [Sorghum bicolor]